QKVMGRSPKSGDFLVFRRTTDIGSVSPSAREGRKHGSPRATIGIRLRLGTTRCVVGPGRQELCDALSEIASRCLVAPQLGFVLGRLLNAQELSGFNSVAMETFVPRLVLIHPPNCLVIPLAGLILFIQPPFGHGQEEPVVAVAAFA